MLDVDHTMIDRINPDDIALFSNLSQQGYTVQQLEFDVDRSQTPKFSSIYGKLADGGKVKEEPEFMSRIKVRHNIGGSFHIKEHIAIRPSLKDFIEELEDLTIPVFFLVCSSNDDIRNKNLVEKLNLHIKGKKFSEVVDFVSRNSFRVKIKIPDKEEVSAKSAVELRKQYNGKYGLISKDDYVILIDQLPDYRFIPSDVNKDLNVRIDAFNIAENEHFDRVNDKEKIKEAIAKIKKFIKIK